MTSRRVAWVIQANMRDSRLRATVEAALDDLGEERWSVSLVPRSTELPALPFAPGGRPIVCLGPSFVPRASGASWQPGIFFDRESFRWSVYSRRWAGRMFTADGQLTTARAALAELEHGAPYFYRPDEDSKAFDGGVYDDPSALRAALGGADPETVVVRGGVRPVDAEWRFFVVDGQVVDSSEYRRGGAASLFRGAPPRALHLAEAVVGRWRPARAFCLDVASSGDHFGVVEVNCLNAARFYAADARVVLAAVRDSLVGRWGES